MWFHSTLSLGFFCFSWHQKWQNYCDKTCSPCRMAHRTCLLSDNSFFCSKFTVFAFFNRKTCCFNRKNLIFYNNFLLCSEHKKIRHMHFSTNCFISKKASIKSDQQQVPVQQSKAISSLSVVTWSCYMRRLWPGDCVVIVNQWASEHFFKTFIQILGPLSPQQCPESDQLIWLLLSGVLVVINCCCLLLKSKCG